MASIEQSVKDRFSKVYAKRDWRLFKTMAEINLAEAAALKKAAFPGVAPKLQLLARNTRKRLLIGIGVELLLKAAYLKGGFSINRPQDKKSGPKLPFKLDDLQGTTLAANETFTLDQLISQIKEVIVLPDPEPVLNGLKVAKVFRNKEGHVVTASHTYDPAEYKSIADALGAIYEHGFSEKLSVGFAFGVGEKGEWRVSAL